MPKAPGIVLFFLAAAMAELLSGSAPPSEFFHPVAFLLLSSLYGSGALIARELKIRWNKGYVLLFVLGTAYGIIEEGLMVKSFFDPNWMDLGVFATYGRWVEVNWVWAEWLTIYHSVFSIAIPIALVELACPEKRNEQWISTKKLVGLMVLLGALTLFGLAFLTDYLPPFPQYFITIVIVILLTLVAWTIPSEAGKTGRVTPPKPLGLAAIGFFTTLALFLLFGAGPHLTGQPIIVMLSGMGIIVLVFGFLRRFNWNETTLHHKFSLIAGAVSFFAGLALLQELDTSRLDNTQGMALIGIAAIILLIVLGRNLQYKEDCDQE